MKNFILFCLLLPCFGVFAQKNANEKALSATQVFLKTLDQETLPRALFPYDTNERRTWFFVPIERKGLPLIDMNEAQKNAAINLVKATVSESASFTLTVTPAGL